MSPGYIIKETNASAEVDETLKRLANCIEDLDNPSTELTDLFTTKSDGICDLESRSLTYFNQILSFKYSYLPFIILNCTMTSWYSILEDDILIRMKTFSDTKAQITNLQ